MNCDFVIKRGQLFPHVEATLADANGEFDGTGATVQFVFRKNKDADPVVRDADWVDEKTGQVRYDWQQGDTDIVGTYLYEWRVILPNVGEVPFPSDRNGIFLVIEGV